MGRIKTTLIKRVSTKLYKEHKESFSDSFADNKKKVETMISGNASKKIRNVIGGYVTRMAKSKA